MVAQPSTLTEAKRLAGLDFMRAFACLLVLAVHLFQKLDAPGLRGSWRFAYDFFIMGSAGVGVFFLLSGFLLARPFWLAYDTGEAVPDLRQYAVRRAARIIPGFYLSLIISFVLSITLFAVPVTGELVFRFIVGFLFLGELHPITLFPVEYNGPLWSIGMEVFSYALMPIAFLAVFSLRGKLGGWRGRILFAVVIGLAIYVHSLIRAHVPVYYEGRGWQFGNIGGAKEWMPKFNPIGFFVFFAMGSLAAGLSVLWNRGRTLFADALALVGLALAIAQLWPTRMPRLPEAYGWLQMPYAFPMFHLGIGLALLAFPHSRYLGAILDNPPVRYFAKVSFGIYIWHMLVIELTRALVDSNYKWGGIRDTNSWLLFSGLVVSVTLIVASASWYLLEKPVLERAAHLGKRGTSAAAIQW